MKIEDAMNFLNDFSSFNDYQEAWGVVYDYILSLEDDAKRMIMMLSENKYGGK